LLFNKFELKLLG